MRAGFDSRQGRLSDPLGRQADTGDSLRASCGRQRSAAGAAFRSDCGGTIGRGARAPIAPPAGDQFLPDQQAGYTFIYNQYSEDSARIREGQDYYNMNLYRGCQHQCIYCDSRSECYGIEDFDGEVLVKVNAIELLRQELARFTTEHALWLQGQRDVRVTVEGLAGFGMPVCPASLMVTIKLSGLL